MRDVPRAYLRSILGANCTSGTDEARTLVSLALDELEPLFQNAESGRYVLSKKEGVDESEVVTAITLATGKFVRSVEWVTPRFNAPVPLFFCNVDSVGLEFNVYGNMDPHMWQRLGDQRLRVLRSVIQTFWRPLCDSIDPATPLHMLRDRICRITFYYLCAVMDGDEEKVSRLTPLIRLLPRAVPMREIQDRSCTWLVFAE